VKGECENERLGNFDEDQESELKENENLRIKSGKSKERDDNNVIKGCRFCKNNFTLTQNHVKWFKERDLSLPEFCSKTCRF